MSRRTTERRVEKLLTRRLSKVIACVSGDWKRKENIVLKTNDVFHLANRIFLEKKCYLERNKKFPYMGMKVH